MSCVHVVLPNDIDDPATPSGGNLYDRRVCTGLTAAGWTVHEHPVRGAWPRPTPTDRAALARVLAALPDDAVVLLDGLVASAVPEVLAGPARRLRLVVLVHMPLGDESAAFEARELRTLSVATAVVTTSQWTRRRLIDWYELPGDRVHVAAPGVDAASLAPASPGGSSLLCVAAVIRAKGQDRLLTALASMKDLSWDCVLVGSLGREPAFVEQLRRRAAAAGIADRIRLAGTRTGNELEASYAAADLMVLPSRAETYAMVVTEALAHGTPVVATAVGGVPEALGRAPDGCLPGLLVPAGDSTALAAALRRWLTGPELRRQLKESARLRRTTLTGWAETARLVANALSGAARNVSADR